MTLYPIFMKMAKVQGNRVRPLSATNGSSNGWTMGKGLDEARRIGQWVVRMLIIIFLLQL